MQNKLITNTSPLTMNRMILLILNYVIGYLYVYPKVGSLIFKSLPNSSPSFLLIIQFCIYSFVIVISIIVAYPLLKESYFIWKDNKTLIFKKNISLLLGLYTVTIASSYVIGLFTKTNTSNNQVGVSSSILQFPLLMAFTTMVFAPVVEEILFRGVFYRCFRPRYGWIIVSLISCIAFGFIHVYDSFIQGSWIDCWYFFVYAGIGFFLCRSYEETNTIFGSIVLHFLNNGIAFLSIFL